jgi:ATP-binding cassette subfamily B protein
LATIAVNEFDFQKTLTENRLAGLWRMMSGYHWHYAGATASLAVSAIAKTTTFLLLRYFVDTVLGQGQYVVSGNLGLTLALIALGFLGLAAIEGSFSYFSGRLAAFTAEGITRRLRNYLFDHIQRRISYHKRPYRRADERCTWM